MIEYLKSLFLLQMGPGPYNLAGLITFMVALFIISLLIGSFFFWVGLKLVGTPESKMGFGGIIVTWLISSILIAYLSLIGIIVMPQAPTGP